jgi:hypothetical protein
MVGIASRYVIAKRKAPAFHILFLYARQILAFSFDEDKAFAKQPLQLPTTD